MVASADLTKQLGLDPALSMSLFKSPEYAQEVWCWLDKHGDTPVMREKFKHLVGICTVKPVKAAPVQPLQRKVSNKPTPQPSQVQLPGRDPPLAHQSSTLFTPAARPATAAAAARRKRASTNRPTTASAGSSRRFVPAIPAPTAPEAVLRTSSLLPQAASNKKATALKASGRLPPQLTKAEAASARTPQRETLTGTKPAAVASAAVYGPSDCATATVALVSAQPEPEAGPGLAPANQPCNSSVALSDEQPDNFAKLEHAPSSAQAVECKQSGTLPSSTSTAEPLPDAAGLPAGTPAKGGTDSTPEQPQPCSQQRPGGEEGLVSTAVGQISRQSSRPSTAKVRSDSPSTFDRRFALLHKGLPTHLPPHTASKPSRLSRSPTPLRASTPLNSSTNNSLLSGTNQVAVSNDAAQNAQKPSDAASDAQQPAMGALQQTQPAVAAATVGDSAALAAVSASSGQEQGLNKPSSPTSVLPGVGLENTTYHNFFSLADAYPQLYQAAAAAGRALKTSDRALQSMIGDTLKGNPDLWRQQLQSAYTVNNDRLKHDAGWGELDEAGDGDFLEWVGRSQLYSADLLAPEAAQDLAHWMATASPPDKRHMMMMLRELHASVSPTGAHWQSVSHSTHSRQTPFVSHKEAERDVDSSSRAGIPLPPPTKEQGNAPVPLSDISTANAQAASYMTRQQQAASPAPQVQPSQAPPKPRGVNVNEVSSKGTFRSSINLSQGAQGTGKSTYSETHGASMPQLLAAVQTASQQHAQAQKPVLVTSPYGTLDPLLDHAHLSVFPVPTGLLSASAELHTDAQRSGLDETHYGQSFCSNTFRGDAAALLAAAQREKETSKAAGMRTTIPLGKKAVNCVPVYDTTYHDEFKARSLDLSQQRASAEHARSMFHAPTASVGCVTRSH